MGVTPRNTLGPMTFGGSAAITAGWRLQARDSATPDFPGCAVSWSADRKTNALSGQRQGAGFTRLHDRNSLI